MNPAAVHSTQPLMPQTMHEDPGKLAAMSEESRHERWAHMHINWGAVWTGTLGAFAAILVIGLIGIAVGAHVLGPEHRLVDLNKMGWGALIFSVCGAFFSFVIGGWIAAKVAGILHAEPAMLHGGIVWLIAVPMLVAMAAVGTGNFFGGWYAGLSGQPSWAAPAGAPFARPEPPGPTASADEVAAYRAKSAEYQQSVEQWAEDTPRATRNSALGAVTALLLGLVGSVVGGWMGSGEPMNFTHYRTRKPIYHQPT
jgi:hypothetical protein